MVKQSWSDDKVRNETQRAICSRIYIHYVKSKIKTLPQFAIHSSDHSIINGKVFSYLTMENGNVYIGYYEHITDILVNLKTKELLKRLNCSLDDIVL